MKKLLVLAMAIAVFILCSCGGSSQSSETEVKKVEISVEKDDYKPAEKDALIILKAYADQNLETLKSYAGGTQKMTLDETYFTENGNAKGFIEKIANWEGAFKEIRYSKEEKNFQQYYYAFAAFYESPSGQITAVALKSTDKENWKLSGFGTKYIKKDEFEQLSTELQE